MGNVECHHGSTANIQPTNGKMFPILVWDGNKSKDRENDLTSSAPGSTLAMISSLKP